jgi:hypothetical protein
LRCLSSEEDDRLYLVCLYVCDRDWDSLSEAEKTLWQCNLALKVVEGRKERKFERVSVFSIIYLFILGNGAFCFYLKIWIGCLWLLSPLSWQFYFILPFYWVIRLGEHTILFFKFIFNIKKINNLKIIKNIFSYKNIFQPQK